MILFSPAIDIALLSLCLVVISRFLQAKLGNTEEIKNSRAAMKEKQKRMKELLKKQDAESKKELEQVQKEMFELMSSSMKGSMRYMMVSMPVFLAAFALIGMNYGSVVIPLPVPIPWFGEAGIQLFNETNWYGWYFLVYLSLSIIAGIVLKVVKK